VNHGASAYSNGKCRCAECREANRERIAMARARRKAGRKGGHPSSLDSPLFHGVSAYQNWGCRCDVCFKAQSEANAANYRRRRLADA
jgi:hypothetical protein